MSSFSFGDKYENVWIKLRGEKIWGSAKQKLLGMEIGRILILMIMFSLCKETEV